MYYIVPQFPDQKGCFIFDEEIASFFELRLVVPDGYHWWGAKSSGRIGGSIGLDSAFFDLTIFTNNEPGDFQLKYAIGNTDFWDDNPYEITTTSEAIPVKIVTSSSISRTSRENEEWEIYPNPSKGQVYIRMESVPDEVIMRIYDLNGRLQKSDLLRESLNSVDLRGLSKGTYIVALENQGEARTKRLVIQ